MQTLLIAISFELEQEVAQVFDVVTTKEPDHDVHLLVEDAQVRHEELQPRQFVPLTIVFPASHVSTQVLDRWSKYLLETHDVH